MKNLKIVVLALMLTACNFPLISTPSTSTPLATSLPTASPSSEATLSFAAAVYRDEAGRFEISYPVDWMVDAQQAGSRGSYVQITSWQHKLGGFTEIPEGGSVLGIAVYLWDPKRDLSARVEMRRNNFLDSGNVILEETAVSYPDGHDGVRFLLEDTTGGQSVVVLLALGDDYLELSGSGDLAILEEMMRSFKFIAQ